MSRLSTTSWRSLLALAGGIFVFAGAACAPGETLSDGLEPEAPLPDSSLNTLAIEPRTPTVPQGQTLRFTARGTLVSGESASPSLDWTASGGTISASGEYSATTSGTFFVIGRGRGRKKLADTAVVTVPAPATLVALSISPDAAELAPGQARRFAAQGRYSDSTTGSVVVTWSATGGTIDANGNYTAGSTAGSARVIGTAASGLADTAAVTITPTAPTLTAVEVTPASASLQTGATQQFTAVGRMSDGSTQAPAVTWSATGGAISAGGLYTAGGTAGTFRVIATQQGGTLADTAVVTLTAPAPAPTLVAVELTPATASLLTGGTQQFAATGRLSSGATQAVTVTWSATGGTVTSAGLYTAGATAGTYRVIATQQGGTLADTSTVTVTAPAPTLTAVEVTPGTASLLTGGTQQFAARARMSDGSTQSVSVTWSATGGSVTTGGLFTAPGTAGSYTVTAREAGGRTGSATVTVSAPTPPPPGGAACQNEPAGYVKVNENPFDAKPAPYGGARDQWGWIVTEDNYPTLTKVIQDATAPVSSPNALRVFFPSGMPGGGGPFAAEGTWTTGGFSGSAPLKLYQCIRIKLSANFDHGGNAGTKISFAQSRTGTINHYLALSPQNDLYFGVEYNKSGWATFNGYTSTAMTRGVWHTIEWLMIPESVAGQRTGQVYLWLDGRPVTWQPQASWNGVTPTGINLFTTGDVMGWRAVKANSTYGGGYNPVPSNADGGIWWDIDHWYASGSN